MTTPTFNEVSLYEAICQMWGENGAHADVYRMLCKEAGVTLPAPVPAESVEDMIRRIFAETGSKIQTIKAIRWEIEGLDLIGAKNLVEKYI